MAFCHRVPDVELECVHLLERVVTHRTAEDSAALCTMPDACKRVRERFSINTEDIERDLDCLTQWYGRMTEGLSVDDPQYARYFFVSEDAEASFGLSLLLADRYPRENKQNSPDCTRVVISEMLSCCGFETELPRDQMPQDIPALIAFLQQYDGTSDAVKWQLLDGVTNFEKHLEKVRELLVPLLQRYTDLLPMLRPMLDRACDEIDRRIAEAGSAKKRLQKLGLVLDVEDLVIQPSAVVFQGISAFGSGETEESARLFLSYGVLYDSLFDLESGSEAADTLLQKLLHALNDKTRLTILTALKDGGKYGQELAKLTGLTPATISHHMSELTSVGLVNIEKQGIRLIYRIDREHADAFLCQMREKLLG